MMFSVSKCKVMHLGQKNHGYSYYMDMKQLDTVEEEHDLGIVITKDLKVSQQCKQAYAKASRMMGVINRSIKSKDKRYFTQPIQISRQTSFGIFYTGIVNSLCERQGTN